MSQRGSLPLLDVVSQLWQQLFYWKGPVRPVKRGPPLQLDVVEDQVWHKIFLEGTVWTAFVGPVPAGG